MGLMSKENRYIAATLQYLIACLDESDADAIRNFGIEPADVARLGKLSLGNIHTISVTHCSFIDSPKIHRDKFLNVIRRMEIEQRKRQGIKELIRADAPHPMMYALFGMDQQEFSKLRRFEGLSGGDGRTRKLSESELETIEANISGMVNTIFDVHQWTWEEWLLLVNLAKLKARLIWKTVEKLIEVEKGNLERHDLLKT